MKKFFASVLTFAICIGAFGQCLADSVQFSDIDKSTELGESVYKLADAGIINGYEDGTFRADAHLTRAELCKMINLTFSFNIASDNTFTDVTTGDWYYIQVLYAINKGYIKGFEDNTFRGDDNVSREQVCVILDRILGLSADSMPEIKDSVSDWAVESVRKVAANGYMSLESDGKFRAEEDITRGELAQALKFFVKDTPADTGEENSDDKKDTSGTVSSSGSSSSGSSGSGSSGSGGSSSGGSSSGGSSSGDSSSGDSSSGDSSSGSGTGTSEDEPKLPGSSDTENSGSDNPEPAGPTAEEIAASEKICVDLMKVLADIELIEFEGEAATVIEYIKKDIEDTLAAAEEGTIITSEYVRTTYSEDINSIKEIINGMDDTQKEEFKGQILKMNTASLQALINYFDINMDYFN